MKFYRVSWYGGDESARMADWATSQRAAARIVAAHKDEDPDMLVVDIEPTRAGILEALHHWADR